MTTPYHERLAAYAARNQRVAERRAEGVSIGKLSAEFGVNRSRIQQILAAEKRRADAGKEA